MLVQNVTLRDDRFFGLNLATPPENLAPGWLTDATNALVVGSVNKSGGYLQTRPGKRAQLTTAAGGAITAGTITLDSAGLPWLVASVGSTTGSAVRWKPGDTTVTAITSLGTVDATKAQFAVLGEYIFVADGGSLKRVKNDWTGGGVVSGLTKPTYAPGATLTNKTLLSLTATGQDYYDPTTYSSGLSPLYNATGPTAWTGWTATNSSGDIEMDQNVDGENLTDYYLRLDNVGPYLRSNAAPNPAKTNTAGYGTGSTTRRPVHVLVSCYFKADYRDDSIILRLIGYSDTAGTTQVVERSVTITSEVYGLGTSTPVQHHNILFSVADLGDDTLVQSWRLELRPGAGNYSRGSLNGPYISRVYLTPIVPQMTVTGAADSVTVVLPPATDANQTHIQENRDYINWGQNRITGDIGSTQNFSTYQHVALPCQLAVSIAPRVRLGFRATTTGTTKYSVVGDLATIAGREYITWDLSTMDPADLASVRYIELVFAGDTAISEGNSGQPLLTLGKLLYAGNLTTDGATYEYRVVETLGGLTSQAGGISLSIDPTDAQAMANVTGFFISGAPTNTGATIIIYRRGGAFPDGAWRKHSSFLIGTSASDVSGWTWDSGMKTLLDNVPDSALLLADKLQDHENAPANVLAVATWNDRLVIATATGLYVSQLQTGIATGVYYNGLAVPTSEGSPTVATDGFYAPLATIRTAGNIVRMVPFLGKLALMFPAARLVLSGDSAANYAISVWNAESGKGAVARNAVTILGGQIVFLSRDGLRAFDLYNDASSARGGDTMLTDAILPAVTPNGFDFTSNSLSATAFALSSVFEHAGRLYLALPTTTSAGEIGITYVFDQDTGGWVPWTLGSIRGGANIDGELYVFDAAGQISKIGNAFGDTTISGGAVSPVTMTVTTRGLSAGAGRVSANRLRLDMQNMDSVASAAVFTVRHDGTGVGEMTFPYSLATGETRERFFVPRVTGRYVTTTVSATALNAPVRLREIEVVATPMVLK